ncbi:hypothetical protein VTL71DRAFT_7243 [Oculimacula yallundae]|uniref:Uncharacterized protein n=1 Tax=Oculimacula yallundae TaxID=86028 RepID=A0ABR4BW63_9HELO
MYLVTTELEWTTGKVNAYHSSIYSNEVIRLLQKRIEDPAYATSDATIAAVASMATIEFGRKNMVMGKIHLNGLKRMVALRGGLLRIAFSNPCVAAAVHWFTLNTLHESIFPVDDTVDQSIHLEYLLQDVINDNVCLSSNYLAASALGLESDISDALVEARYLCEKFNMSRFDNVHWPVNSIIQRLLHFNTTNKTTFTTSLNDACRYAICIFLFLPFGNQFPDPSLLVNTYLYKLKGSLNQLVISSISNIPLLFWLLSIGAAISTNSLERDWFVGHLIPVAESLDISSWKDMEQRMQQILWISNYLDCLFVRVWTDVKHRIAARDIDEPFMTSKDITRPPNSPPTIVS